MKCRQIATGFIWCLLLVPISVNAEEQKTPESPQTTESIKQETPDQDKAAAKEESPKDEWGEDKNQEQVDTVFKNPMPGGAYGAIILSTGKIGNTGGTMLGGRGTWMFSRNWGVGIAAKTLSSQYDDKLPTDYYLIYRHNGLTLEYTWNASSRFHWNTVLLLGEGRISLGDQYGDKEQNRDFFPVAKLEINGEWNLTQYARFFLGVNQRWVKDIHLAGFKPEDFMHPQAQLGLKLGMF